ncbi:hypothetical protein [Streptomyces sp. enrichment culture]
MLNRPDAGPWPSSRAPAIAGAGIAAATPAASSSIGGSTSAT